MASGLARVTACAVLLGLSGCGAAEGPVSIRFAAFADGAPLACASPDPALTDLRLFVHDVVLLTDAGKDIPLKIDAAAPWQNDTVALVDLEDGQGSCETGSTATHTALTGHAAKGAYRGLRFTVGVPFALNHADPALAAAPLDQTTMHWHWQAGYKFLRAGVKRDDQQTFLHLGATGCEGRIGKVTSCARPNRVTVTLAAFNPATDTVGIDLGALFKEAQGSACQSEPDNAACAALFAPLGLGDKPQNVFRRVGPG